MDTIQTWVFLRRLLANVAASPQTLQKIQDEHLRAAIAHASAHVPFYRHYWNESGFDVSRFRGLQDLERIPMATKEMMYEAAEKGQLLASGVETDHCAYLDSSGSTGKPMRIWKRPLEERVRRAVGLRIWIEHGFEWRHKTAQFQIKAGPAHFLQALGVSRKTWISTAHSIDDQLSEFLKTKADIVVGTPTAIRNLSRALETAGTRPKKPFVIFCAGELIDQQTCDVVRDIFDMDPVGIYGQTEVGYIAWQCEQRNGFHFNADTHLVEIIRRGRTVEPGEMGTIVVTDLHARTMPFIRYDTQDLAVAAGERCPCGRSLPLVASIEGRVHSCIHLGNNRIVTTRQVINHMAEFVRLGEYQMIQGEIGHIRLKLSPAAYQHSACAEKSIFESQLTHHLRKMIGHTSITITSMNPQEPTSTGKTHTLLSKVPASEFTAR